MNLSNRNNYEFEIRNIGGSDVYYRRKIGNKKWLFSSKEEFELNKDIMNKDYTESDVQRGAEIELKEHKNTLLKYVKDGVDLMGVARDIAIDHLKENPKSYPNEDVISLNVPLLIRLLELAREDIKSDADLHKVIEKVIISSKKDGYLTMADYDGFLENTIKENSFAKGGNIMLAPNGKPSNLNPKQWELVRTSEFKTWFGDWENDPTNASKVVDENGEPMVCYHATDNKFWEFKKEKQTIGYYGKGFYFSNNLEHAKQYGKRVIPVFLNIKSVFELSDKTPQELLNKLAETNIDVSNLDIKDIEQRSKYTFGYESENSDIFINNLIKNGYYGIRMIYNLESSNYFYIVFEPNQIKLADGKNTIFNGNNPDIRFDGGGSIDTNFLPKEFKGKDDIIYLKVKSRKNPNGETVVNYELYWNGHLIDNIWVGSLKELEDYSENRILSISQYNKLKWLEKNPLPKYADGGLIAPNGKPSNLNPKQWELVRTPEFKEWFGDWENDPTNASKVVDENGEPLVVYHGSKSRFTIFEKTKGKRSSLAGVESVISSGFFFSPIIEFTDSFGDEKYSCFLNIKNIFDISTGNYEQKEMYEKVTGRSFDSDNPFGVYSTWEYFDGDEFDISEDIKKSGFDGVKIAEKNPDDESMYSDVYICFNSNQIKLADGSNTNFDSNNPDIRFEDGGKIQLNSNKGKVNLKLEKYWRDDTELVPVSELLKFREFNRFERPKYSLEDSKENIFSLEKELINNGVEEPLIIEYSLEDNAVLLVEGNHRLNVAENLGFDYLPARVILRRREFNHIQKPKSMKVKGFKPDEYGYVPSNLKPSQIGIAGTIKAFEEGGIIEGQLHSECNEETGCGEKFDVGGVGHIIEAERDEAVIVSKAFQDPKEYEIKGTPSEIASAINVIGGGKNFDSGAEIKTEDGDKIKVSEIKKEAKNTDVETIDPNSIIINRRSMYDDKEYIAKGTTKQIASQINNLNDNGVKIVDGGSIKEA